MGPIKKQNNKITGHLCKKREKIKNTFLIKFYLACHKEHLPISELLLKEGANKEAKQQNKWTPLHIGKQKKRKKIINIYKIILIQHRKLVIRELLNYFFKTELK